MITVASSKVDLVRRLINEQSELLKQGIAITGGDYMYRVKYEYSDLNSIKPQMIEEATKNARMLLRNLLQTATANLARLNALHKVNSALATETSLHLILKR